MYSRYNVGITWRTDTVGGLKANSLGANVMAADTLHHIYLGGEHGSGLWAYDSTLNKWNQLNIPTGMPAATNAVKYIGFDNNNNMVVYFADEAIGSFNRGLYCSSNGGVSWNKIGLDSATVYQVIPWIGDTSIILTDLGVFKMTCGAGLIVTPNCTPSFKAIFKTICYGDTLHLNNHHYTLNGTYHDTIPNYAGCDSVITTILTVRPKVNITYSATGITVNPLSIDTFEIMCRNTIQITTTHHFISYTWCDGSQGDTLTHFFPEYDGLKPFNCSLSVVDSFGCKSTSTIVTLVFECEGINEIASEKYFSLYPNPTKDELVIEVHQNNVSENTITVFDITSKEIFSKKTFEKTIYLNLSKYANGTYIVQLKNKDGVFTRKVAKD